MAKRSSYLLAVLLIANPIMLLFFQNCSKAPQHVNKTPVVAETVGKSPT